MLEPAISFQYSSPVSNFILCLAARRCREHRPAFCYRLPHAVCAPMGKCCKRMDSTTCLVAFDGGMCWKLEGMSLVNAVNG